MTATVSAGKRERRVPDITKFKVGIPDDDDHYPTSDGKPMGETDWHIDVMLSCREALKNFYRSRSDVYVAGNNMLYYLEGDPSAVVSPDCYVVFGVANSPRSSYKTWHENGVLPRMVLEITSGKTRRADLTLKYTLYERVLRVPEYFLFDPIGKYLMPNLVGYRLGANGYEMIPRDENGRLHSDALNLDLFQEGQSLRFYNPATQLVLLTYREEQERANRETERADAAEAELARLRAEIEALRKQSGA